MSDGNLREEGGRNLPLSGVRITLVGSGIHEKLGGGARMGGLVQILHDAGALTNFVSFLPYAEEIEIRREHLKARTSCITLSLPSNWRRLIKALSMSVFVFSSIIVLSRRTDVVWTSCGSTLSNAPAVIASRLCRKPVLYDLLDLEIEAPEYLTRTVVRNVDAVFACSHFLESKARAYGNRNVFYVPCFVNPSRFHRDEGFRKKWRARWRVSDDIVVVGYAGVTNMGEGVAVLLKAFKILHESHPDTRLAILGVSRKTIGQWDDIPMLVRELAIQEHVITVEPMAHSEVPGFLSACDILVAPKLKVPSNSATIPIKLVEYLSMGVPVVTTCFGEDDVVVVTNNVDGYIANPGDEGDLARVISEIISNPAEARKVGSSGPSRVAREFTSDVVGSTICGAIMKVLRRRSSER